MISHSFPSYNEKVIYKAYEALKNGNFSKRVISDEAEKVLAQFTNARFSKLMASGFTALQSALIGIGVQQGEYVTIPNVTCPSIYHAIKSIGAVPHVIDVGREQPIMSTDSIKEQGASEYIIVPNMFGIKASIDKVCFPNTKFIVDNAQCFSNQQNSWSDISVYSFSPTKLMTVGYAGAIITDSELYKNRIACFLDSEHSIYDNCSNDLTLPFRIHADISDFQAAMLIEQIKRFDQIIEFREKIFSVYDTIIGKKRLFPEIPFRYQIILDEPEAEKIAKLLQEEGISAVPLSSHLLSDTFGIEGQFENSKWWKNHVISIPVHESISLDQSEWIAKKVREFI